MGTVYLATDTALERPVALKIPLLHGAENAMVLERFRREARAVAALEHPNICAVYDVGEHDGQPYMAMAYVRGRPLSERMALCGASPLEDDLTLVEKLARALQYAHEQGVIHRDLKPANIMLNDQNEPVVMDFGLARRDVGDAGLTQTGQIMGTPAYMAPEQITGRPAEVGRKSDIYSLGVVLYQLLTQRLPFESNGDVLSLLARVLMDPPVPPTTHRPTLDAALDRLVLRAIEKKPEDRYASMTEFAEAIASFRRSSQSTLTAHVAKGQCSEPTFTSMTYPGRRKAGMFVAAGLGIVAAIILGINVIISSPTNRAQDISDVKNTSPGREKISDVEPTATTPLKAPLTAARPIPAPRAAAIDDVVGNRVNGWNRLLPANTELKNGWTITDGVLRSDITFDLKGVNLGRITAQDYELRARFTIESGSHTIAWILPIREKFVLLCLNGGRHGEGKRWCGFEPIENLSNAQNASGVERAAIPAGEEQELGVEVRHVDDKVYLTSRLNSEPLSSWSGHHSLVGISRFRANGLTWVESPSTVGVAASQTRYAIRSVAWRPILTGSTSSIDLEFSND